MKAVAVLLALLVSFQCAAGYQGFIRASGERFVDDNCQEFVPLGMNTWLLLESAVGTLIDSPMNPYGLDTVDFTMEVAANNSQTTARVFAHGINSTLALQPEQGVYNEKAFQALDYIISRAAHYGIKLILTFGDEWNTADSKINYLEWGNATDNSNEFFTSDTLQGFYKDHILTMVNRNNTYTNTLYKNDPTIMAWDLMNEVRCECFPVSLYPAFPTNVECLPTCGDALDSWVQMMANYTKTVDPNHMVTVGYEGFWGEYDADVQYNPGNGWAGITGQNFSRNMAHVEIDFTEIHYWPDEWFANQQDITYDAAQFLTSWFNQHAAVATALGKPLLLEEFGKAVNNTAAGNGVQAAPSAESIASVRDTYFSTVYQQANDAMTANAPMSTLRGAMWWQWDMTNTPFVFDGGNLEVSYQDSTFQDVIAPQSKTILGAAAATVDSCTKINQKTGTTATAAAGRRLLGA
uniref:mannan endo-1,4-beta-mannosidase n=1 Tax=Trebouxia lynnae TaxID=1825957 RepID=A0A7L9QED5_9CHLO|nr:putative extracellular protein TR9_011b [Trebouxia lynnae]